jgi:hypothetical protein
VSAADAYAAALVAHARFRAALAEGRDPYALDGAPLGDVAEALVAGADERPRALLAAIVDAHASLGPALVEPRRVLGDAAHDGLTLDLDGVHAASTAALAALLARALHLPPALRVEATCAGLLADLATAIAPPHFRRLRRRLEPDERRALDDDAARAVGALMVGGHRDVGFLTRLVVAYEHHGRARDAHPLSRLVAVACATAALTLPRPWRDARGWEDARATLRRADPARYDPLVLDALDATWAAFAPRAAPAISP